MVTCTNCPQCGTLRLEANPCDWSDTFVIPYGLFGVFLVRSGTVSRDASLLEFRIICADSDNPFDGNRKRLCHVSLSPMKVAGFRCRRQLRRLVRCRHAGQGDGREFEITSLSCVILSFKLVLAVIHEGSLVTLWNGNGW